ncbi:putative porin [Hymenobacter sp. RP-2-7]|uniref:Putative porin n=1 Tax=Hymenobacter polaris TaxID=2682546 RepID=A0A7Y0AB37_9BACT|nr:putative porin [Hymenobacter polaris]NML64104.1 putative porin [Hymenobacter polaris]
MYANYSFYWSPAARRWLLLLLGLLLGSAARAQIVDDSTKTVYGPKTTRVIYEREVRRDSVGGTIIDTTLTKFSQERFWAHDTTFQQNLGALATASQPLLYQPNLALGTRFGRHAFDRNTPAGSEVPYYDSRSPYSFFRFIQGSQGEQVFEISYSRSFKKNFSVGIDYERIASNQVLNTGGNQWLAEHNNVTFFTRFQTEDGRYHLLFNYIASRQRTREQGGIWPTDDEVALIKGNGGNLGNILFDYSNERTYLTPGINIDDRDQVHLFQSYRLARRGFTAYHVLDAGRQYNGYNDDALPRAADDALLFYPNPPGLLNGRQRGVYRNATATSDRATYRQVENTFGLLGRTDRVEYNLYGRARNASLLELSTPSPSRTATSPTPVLRSGVGLPLKPVYQQTYFDGFVGGSAAFNYRTIYAVEVAGEYKFFNEYYLRGSIRTGPLSAELTTASYSPTLTQRKFVGNHYQWPDSSHSNVNSFSNTLANQVSVRLQQRLPLLAGHSIDARVSVVNLNKYIYYDTLGRPTQDNASRTLLIVFARHRFELGKFHFDNQATYTRGADKDNAALRIPALVTESRVYYQTSVFKSALFGQVGAEYTYQSSWYGYNYAPSTQQFYVQNSFLLPAYGVANVFVAADIKSASIFIKAAYVNQGLGPNGYFTAPYYTGYPRRLQFGVRWRFFN